MNDLLRTFIAVKIAPEKKLQEMFIYLKESLRDEQIKWVNENNLHLTLKFLGETSVRQTEEIKAKLELISRDFQTFPLILKGLGFFKSKRQPKVLFAQIENANQLKAIALAIDESLLELGFEPEKRKFSPHLTLARIRDLKDMGKFQRLVESYKNMRFQDDTLSEIIFYQSILKPQGAVYKPIETFKLND